MAGEMAESGWTMSSVLATKQRCLTADMAHGELLMAVVIIAEMQLLSAPMVRNQIRDEDYCCRYVRQVCQTLLKPTSCTNEPIP